jgi:hypothetical protein
LRVVLPGIGAGALSDVDVVPVERRMTRPESAMTVGADFGPGLFELAGYTLQPGPVTRFSLVWRAGAASPEVDYTVFVHVQDAAGQIVAQADHAPRQGSYPTSMWMPGEYVVDDYEFSLAPGEYTVEVGLYEAETGERLMASPAGQSPTDQIVLSGLRVP